MQRAVLVGLGGLAVGGCSGYAVASLGLALPWLGVLLSVCAIALLLARGHPVAATPLPASSDASWKGWEMLHRELERCRRHEHCCTLVRIRQEPHSAGAAARDVGHAQHVWAAALRATDNVWQDRTELYLLLTETDRAAAQAFLARIVRDASGLPAPHGIQFASFPADALTLGGLLLALETPGQADDTRVEGQDQLRRA